MAVVWADLAPAFAFSATTLDSIFTRFPPADPQIALIQAALVKLYNGSATRRVMNQDLLQAILAMDAYNRTGLPYSARMRVPFRS
jgi:hypothetical protein